MKRVPFLFEEIFKFILECSLPSPFISEPILLGPHLQFLCDSSACLYKTAAGIFTTLPPFGLSVSLFLRLFQGQFILAPGFSFSCYLKSINRFIFLRHPISKFLSLSILGRLKFIYNFSPILNLCLWIDPFWDFPRACPYRAAPGLSLL